MARVLELVDRHASEACGLYDRVGSNPTSGTFTLFFLFRAGDGIGRHLRLRSVGLFGVRVQVPPRAPRQTRFYQKPSLKAWRVRRAYQ